MIRYPDLLQGEKNKSYKKILRNLSPANGLQAFELKGFKELYTVKCHIIRIPVVDMRFFFGTVHPADTRVYVSLFFLYAHRLHKTKQKQKTPRRGRQRKGRPDTAAVSSSSVPCLSVARGVRSKVCCVYACVLFEAAVDKRRLRHDFPGRFLQGDFFIFVFYEARNGRVATELFVGGARYL